jgi:hypothetical protein
MNEYTMTIGELSITFEYEKRPADYEVGYTMDWWHYEILSVELLNFYLMYNPIDILNILPVDVIDRINEQIDEYLKRI